MTTRRNMLTALGLCVLAAPLGAYAQQPGKVWRVGFLTQRRLVSFDADPIYRAFPDAMHKLGYVEGRNLVIDLRHGDGKIEPLASLAAELVKLKVDVIVTAGTPATQAAQKATATIPIVMGTVNEPVGSGLVKTLAAPGGNITGLSNMSADLSQKHMEMLLSMAPKLSRVAVLVNPANSSRAMVLKNVQAAAQRYRVTVVPVEAGAPQAIENAFSMMARQNVGAVIVTGDSIFTGEVRQIAALANKYRMPSIYVIREYAEAGGLMSYGQHIADQFRRAATYVDKIFKGARPGDLPVEQSTKFELLINRRTVKALGLTIPSELLLLADEVIE
jgi:putative ABC transport system substrate-binding protein